MLAFAYEPEGGKTARLYMANADGSDLVLIDETQGDIQNLQWSPNGTKIAYRWLRGGDYTDTPIIVIDADLIVWNVRASGPGWKSEGTIIAKNVAPMVYDSICGLDGGLTCSSYGFGPALFGTISLAPVVAVETRQPRGPEAR